MELHGALNNGMHHVHVYSLYGIWELQTVQYYIVEMDKLTEHGGVETTKFNSHSHSAS